MTEEPAIDAAPPTAPPRGALLTVFLVVVIDLLGFAIVLPLLLRIAKAYLAGQEKWVTALTIGMLFSSFSLMQFIFAPLWGRLSDRIGRRPVLLVGLAGSVVFYAIFGYGATVDPSHAKLAISLMFFARIGAGIAGATIATAAAVIADCTPPEQRKRGMALIGAAFGIGFTFGPLIAYAAIRLLPSQGHGAVGYVAAGLSFIALLIGMIQLRETRVAGRPGERRGWLNFHQLAETLKTPTVGLLVATYFLATFGFANFEGTLSLLSDSLHFTDEQNFLIFAFIGFVLVFVQGGIYRRIAHRWSEVTFIRIGVLLMMLGLAGVAVVAATLKPADDTGGASLVPLLTVMAIAVAGFAFLNPSVSALISRRSDPARQGEVLGVNQSANAMARILGPLIGNMLFPITDNHVLPYIVAAVFLLVVLMLTPRLSQGHDPANARR
jgi:MFS transporter, DHA1 family, tetracycline resistance protein